MGHKEQGFTLLELLVVLVLLTSVAGLFIDPIARIYDLKARLNAFIEGAPQEILPPQWFHKTVKELYLGGEKFEGTDKKFSGETGASFDEPAGVPMPFGWEIEYDRDSDKSTLSYINALEESRVILSWPGDSGQFSYYDSEDKKWVEEWQSSPFTQSDQLKLPSLIRMEAMRDGEEFMIQAAFEKSRGHEKKKKISAYDKKINNMREGRDLEVPEKKSPEFPLKR